MLYINHYHSPLGDILLTADEIGLTGLWFDGSKYYADHLNSQHEEKDTPILQQAKEWLAIYFSCTEPPFLPPIHMIGTPFQLNVWAFLQKIPYGETTTYGQIAKEIAEQKGIPRMAAQAVGGAVGRNNIPIIIPCHRVLGSGGRLTGYGGGLEKKVKLLTLEQVDMNHLF